MDKLTIANLAKRVKSPKYAPDILSLNRRQFLLGAAALSLFGPYLQAGAQSGKVIRIGGLDLTNALTAVQNLKKGLYEAISALTGKAQSSIPWKELFPEEKNISLKIDTRSPLSATNGQLVSAVLELLYEQTIDPWKVTVWDKRISDVNSRGYILNTKMGRHQVTATELKNQPGNGEEGYSNRKGYQPKERSKDSDDKIEKTERIASLISNHVVGAKTALIDLPTPKHNPLVGIDGSLLSLAFGSVSNTGRFYESAEDMIEAIVGILKLKPFSAHALTIMDATNYVFEGGPVGLAAWHAKDNSLLLGFDPVAVDTVALEMIDQKRMEVSLPSIRETGMRLLKAADEAGLGTSKPELIRINASRT